MFLNQKLTAVATPITSPLRFMRDHRISKIDCRIGLKFKLSDRQGVILIERPFVETIPTETELESPSEIQMTNHQPVAHINFVAVSQFKIWQFDF